MADRDGLYRDFHNIDLAHLKAMVRDNRIDAGVAHTLLAYWQRRIDDPNDAIYSRYMEYYLFFEALRALFLTVFVYDMKTGTVGHSYGIFPALSPAVYATISGNAEQTDAGVIDFEHNGRNYALHFLRSGYHDQEYTIAALALKDAPIVENLRRLKYVFERFYLPSGFSRDDRIAALFTHTDNLIVEWISPTLAQNQPVTFTYLYFESLTKYVGITGEYFAQEMLDELQKDVHRILKEPDRSIVLSTREILIVSLNCDEEVMRKRFANAYFHAKSLLLSYQVNFYTLTMPVTEIHSHWDKISANLAYKKKIGHAVS